jgi:hypothetical protein
MKVDVVVVHMGDIPFMHPHQNDNWVLVQDVLELPPCATGNMWKLRMHDNDLWLL